MTAVQSGHMAALREGAAAAAPGRRFVVEAAGGDLFDWLERLCSNPVAELAPGRCARAVLMDGKGKMRCDVRVIRPPEGEGVLLDLPAGPRQALLRVLDMFVITDDVTLTDRGDALAFVSLLGPRAGEVAAAAGLPEVAEDGAQGGEVASADGALVMASRLCGPGGLDLLVDADAVNPTLARLVEAGATPVDLAALQLRRIERGVPWFEDDMADGVIPLEARLDDHVSITKGCYPGQEVVARITNLGQVSRRLATLVGPLDGSLQPGDELTGTGELDGKSAGVVTSVARDEAAGRTLALGYLRRAFWDDGTTVRAGDAEWVVGTPG